MNIIKTLKSSISEKGNYCYSLPVETTKEIIKDVKQLQQENQELKKQLEEYDRKLFITKNELDMRQKSIDNKLNQQKEFIELFEKEIVDSKAGSSQQYYAKEHLRLFKEIIGVSNE